MKDYLYNCPYPGLTYITVYALFLSFVFYEEKKRRHLNAQFQTSKHNITNK